MNNNYMQDFADMPDCPDNYDGEWEMETMVTDSVLSDRVLGVVACSAAGDALGAGYEFGQAFDGEVVMEGGGGFDWSPGEWTDDTQLAAVILQALASQPNRVNSVDLAAIESGFRSWFNSGPRDVGIQTGQILSCAGSLKDIAANYTASKATRPPAGNGSLMRTGPIALAYPGKPEAIAALAASVSELTHPAEDCVDACVLWSVAIDYTMHNAPHSSEQWDWLAPLLYAVEYLPTKQRRQRWTQLINEAATANPRDFTDSNGWVVHAFQSAVAAICSTPVPEGTFPARHLQLVLEKIVQAGGDTDTVAAIAGSMLGSRWGSTALPFQWRRKLHGHRVYGEPVLRCSDLERLARRVFKTDSSDDQWPEIATWVPYYKQTHGRKPIRVNLAGIEFGNAPALDDAIANGADTVISLCRMGTNEVPLGVEHHVLGFIDSNPSDNPNLPLLLLELVEGLRQYRKEGKKVFVHCVASANRTPTVAAAWLQYEGVFSTEEALDHVSRELNTFGPKLFQAEAVMAMSKG
jgi:ADP-ribosylglycohydrolase